MQKEVYPKHDAYYQLGRYQSKTSIIKSTENIMFNWINKIFGSTPKKVKKLKPLVLVPKKADLNKMTKQALEDLGRKHKIELDRRQAKDKLVNQLYKHIKSLNK